MTDDRPPAALAFDLGGTELRAALVAASGTILAFASAATLAKAGPAAVIEQMVALAGTVQAHAPAVRLLGVGVGAPGPLDPEEGVVLDAPTLDGWRQVPLAERLGARLGRSVRIENDANAAALGEWRYGAGRGTRSMVFVTVSTGIGGGIIAGGRILHGRRGLAGEIGHMAITGESRPCFCGAIGCFEAVASGSALGEEATRATAPGDGSDLRRRSEDGPVSARHVVEAARAGDLKALALLDAEARWLGIGFTNLLHLYSPEVIVVGGGLSNGLDLMAHGITTTIGARAMRPYRDVPVRRATLGNHAGLIGAASLILAGDGEAISREANHG
ncbi:ROK family protein [Ensifer soli]|uniref:ROK family protein n=1 Tax=Ciceribacter sp. sgz301302 TaxID=3342379 RepID=UPI0035BB39C1